MDPFTILAIAAGALTAGGTVMQYRAQQQAAEQQQATAEYNAQVAEQQAKREVEASAREQMQMREKGRQLIGKQRSMMAKSGVALTSGSPLELLADTAAELETDVEMAAYEGKSRRDARLSQATASTLRAKQAGKRASTYGSMTFPAAITSGVSSGIQSYSLLDS